MNLFHLFGFTFLVFGSSTSATRLIFFIGCFLDGSCFFKKPAEILCQLFQGFSGGCILSELEMISFLPVNFF